MLKPRASGSATSITAELWGLRDGLIICSQLHLPAIDSENPPPHVLLLMYLDNFGMYYERSGVLNTQIMLASSMKHPLLPKKKKINVNRATSKNKSFV